MKRVHERAFLHMYHSIMVSCADVSECSDVNYCSGYHFSSSQIVVNTQTNRSANAHDGVVSNQFHGGVVEGLIKVVQKIIGFYTEYMWLLVTNVTIHGYLIKVINWICAI